PRPAAGAAGLRVGPPAGAGGARGLPRRPPADLVLPGALVRPEIPSRRAHAERPAFRGPMRPVARAGTPVTTVSGSTSHVTTAPAATTARSPTVTPGRIREPAPR